MSVENTPFLHHRSTPPGSLVLAGRGRGEEQRLLNGTSAAYVEGNTLGGGWSYRINRLTKPGGRIAYSALLTRDHNTANSNRMYLWLAEFDSLGEARKAAVETHVRWQTISHPAL